MAFCNNCGSAVPDGAQFCQKCGARILSPVSPSLGAPLPAGTPAVAPVAPGAPGPYVPPGYPRAPGSFPPTMDLRPIPLPADLPFHPQMDEVIFREIVPQRQLLYRLILSGLLSSLVFLVFIIPFSLSFLLAGAASGAALALIAFFFVIVIIFFVVSFVYAFLAYRKFRYWITNHRTVGRRGVIGYSIDSIPLETISDVVVQRSVADRLFGLSSIWIQPFGGGGMGGYGGGQYRFGSIAGANSFLGLRPDEATRIQQEIFYLRDVRRRETGRLI